MGSKNEPPLDEIQWSSTGSLHKYQGLHNNSVLFYFAESPFFDPMSNNAIVFAQALNNQSQLFIVATREAFETRLREMSGLEFVVAQEPAETGPGVGTGVWVIRKQTRRKVQPELIGGVVVTHPDEIEVHSDYFIVGDNIYKAPTLASILTSRIATISSSISKIFPVVDSIQKWSPASGHSYKTPTTAPVAARARGMLDSKEATPMPDVGSGDNNAAAAQQKSNGLSLPNARLAEESFLLHTRFGGEYMDENPITGKPGEFHLSSTGRKDRQQAAATGAKGLPLLQTSADSSPLNKDGKAEKAGKSGAGGPPKPKRRKSKGGTTPS